MTQAVRSTKEKVSAATGPLGDLAHGPAADRLKSEVRDYLGAQAQNLLAGVGRKLGRGTALLNDVAEGNSPGFLKLAKDSGRKIAEGKGPMRTALEVGGGHLKDRVSGAFKGLTGKEKDEGGGGGEGGKDSSATVVMESIDVGVPRRTAYDQWTQYQEFSSFTKGVKSVQQADEDTETDWKAKIFLSSRDWKATTTEQVPDDRIAWTSEGSKGTTKGVVSFHELAPSLTRVLLVLEYYPQGFVEKTGNLWRAQGRRARLDLKHFARYITIRGEASDSWRGEIRDSEVVRSHEDAVEAEESEGDAGDEERSEDEERDAGPEGSHEEYEDEADAGYEEAAPDDEGDEGAEGDEYDESADEAEDEGPYDDEAEDAYEDDEEAGYEDEEGAGEQPDEAEDEAEPAEEPRRGRAGAGGRSRR